MCFIWCHGVELLYSTSINSLTGRVQLSGLPGVVVSAHTNRDLSVHSQPFLPCCVLNLDGGSELDRRDKDIFTFQRWNMAGRVLERVGRVQEQRDGLSTLKYP